MSPQIKPKNNSFNYGDYLNWPEDERWELIDGVPYNLTPAPSRAHQKILAAVLTKFYSFLEDKDCEVYSAPFDVRLPEGEEEPQEITTVVQPDLVVAVGSGVINDLSKWAAFQLGIPYLVVATAASMNGYSSANVAPTMGGVKMLIEARAPRAVIAEPRIIEQAPYAMTAAGFGDTIGRR